VGGRLISCCAAEKYGRHNALSLIPGVKFQSCFRSCAEMRRQPSNPRRKTHGSPDANLSRVCVHPPGLAPPPSAPCPPAPSSTGRWGRVPRFRPPEVVHAEYSQWGRSSNHRFSPWLPPNSLQFFLGRGLARRHWQPGPPRQQLGARSLVIVSPGINNNRAWPHAFSVQDRDRLVPSPCPGRCRILGSPLLDFRGIPGEAKDTSQAIEAGPRDRRGRTGRAGRRPPRRGYTFSTRQDEPLYT